MFLQRGLSLPYCRGHAILSSSLRIRKLLPIRRYEDMKLLMQVYVP